MEFRDSGELFWAETVTCPACGVGGLHAEMRDGFVVFLAGPRPHVCRPSRMRRAQRSSGFFTGLLVAFLGLLLFAHSAKAADGIASWYGDECRGKLMANGKPFNPDALTCASWHYPFGTRLQVRHKNRVVFVTVTDRGPAKRLHRLIDLSRAAFKRLADPARGLIQVSVDPID